MKKEVKVEGGSTIRGRCRFGCRFGGRRCCWFGSGSRSRCGSEADASLLVDLLHLAVERLVVVPSTKGEDVSSANCCDVFGPLRREVVVWCISHIYSNQGGLKAKNFKKKGTREKKVL